MHLVPQTRRMPKVPCILFLAVLHSLPLCSFGRTAFQNLLKYIVVQRVLYRSAAKAFWRLASSLLRLWKAIPLAPGTTGKDYGGSLYIIGDSTIPFEAQYLYIDTKTGLTRRRHPLGIADCSLPIWDRLHTCVVAECGAKLFGYDPGRGSRWAKRSVSKIPVVGVRQQFR